MANRRQAERQNAASEVRRSESALLEQQRVHETVTSNSTAALFIVDDKQRCTFMNPAAEHLTGFSLSEVQGRALHDVIHHTRPDGSPYPLEECPIDRALPKNDRESGEESFVHRDGHFYAVAFTASPIRNADGKATGTVLEVRDIGKSKRIEDSLRRSEARYRCLAAVVSDVVWVTDKSGAFVAPQKEWQQYTGQSWEDHRDFNWLNALHPEDRPLIREVWENACRDRTIYEARGRLWHAASGESNAWRHFSRCYTRRRPAARQSRQPGFRKRSAVLTALKR